MYPILAQQWGYRSGAASNEAILVHTQNIPSLTADIETSWTTEALSDTGTAITSLWSSL
jgi:hypothetical protein